jgi:protein-disulfide isomerase
MDTLRSSPSWLLPVAIVMAGIIVAIATYAVNVHQQVAKKDGDPTIVRPVTPLGDHILGNPAARIMVVEYGDIDSAPTKEFNAVMEQLVTEYGTDGDVAWVFRHFPIIALHPNAAAHASAAECVASLGGPDAFWRFIDGIAVNAPGSNEFSPKDYPLLLPGLNVSKEAFTNCIANGTFENHVQADYTNAILAGATGSPYIVLLVKGQRPIPISGALPYTSMKKILDDYLAKQS